MDSFKDGVDHYAADKNDKKDCHDTPLNIVFSCSISII